VVDLATLGNGFLGTTFQDFQNCCSRSFSAAFAQATRRARRYRGGHWPDRGQVIRHARPPQIVFLALLPVSARFVAARK
jgi:hypothetical protein